MMTSALPQFMKLSTYHKLSDYHHTLVLIPTLQSTHKIDMSKLLFLVGNSNAGKDWVAENRYKNYTPYKLNQCFKTVFELDHGLVPGTCNDKTKREEIILSGPLRDLTISQAMVMSYKQSLENYGYGSKFKTITIRAAFDILDFLSRSNQSVVITDLRKSTELKALLLFSEIIKYEPEMIHVFSENETPLKSDESLYDNISLFQQLTHKTVNKYHNKYVRAN